jgi:long-chain fatty acid transport protein
MRSFLKQALAFSIITIAPATAYATNGMYMIGYGAKSTAMGGVGVAYPQDGMAAAFNAAAMTEVGESRLDGTIEFFNPPRAVKHDAGSPLGPADARSKDDFFPIPAIGAVLSGPGTPFAMGMAIVGAGLGTNYAQSDAAFFDPIGTTPELTGYERVGVFLMQMQMLPSIAFKVTENQSIGGSLVIAAQTFRAFGLEAFSGLGYTVDNDNFTNRGYDWSFGWGLRGGWFGKFLDGRLNLGANYSPRVQMQKFNRYKGLFAEHGEFDIPENYAVGVAFKFTPKLDVAFDIQRILWTDVRSIGNAGPLASDPATFFPYCPQGSDTTPCKLGQDLGMGFGWRNQNVYKIGFAYKYNKDLVLRAGYNYGKTPIPEDQVLFNMLAPATVEKHVTFGATYTLENKDDLSFSFMHAFKNTIRGPTAFGPGGAIVQGSNAAISMKQTSLGIAYGLKF